MVAVEELCLLVVVVLLFFCDDVDVVGVKLEEVRSKEECKWRAGCKVGQTTQRHKHSRRRRSYIRPRLLSR